MKKLWLTALVATAFTATATPDLTLLKKILPAETTVKSVNPSPIAGIYEVNVEGGVVYLSENGEYAISGDLYNLKDDYSYTERKVNGMREDALAKVKDSDKIIYKAKNEKYKVLVFTDIDCGYCAKLHGQMAQYNDAGITIEYLAFPRQGVKSQSGKNMQRIWCAENKTIALTNAKLNREMPKKDCEGNQVAEQFALGEKMGVYATPTMIFSDGELQAGYIEPQALAELLAEKANKAK